MDDRFNETIHTAFRFVVDVVAGAVTDATHRAAVLHHFDGNVIVVHTRGIRVDAGETIEATSRALAVARKEKMVMRLVVHAPSPFDGQMLEEGLYKRNAQ